MAGLRVLSGLVAGVAMLALATSVGPAGGAAPKDIGATGTIEPRGGVVTVPGVPGAVILAIKVRAGQPVKQGDVLMVLQDREARVDTEAALNDAQLQRRHASQAVADEAEQLKVAEDRARRAEAEAEAYRALGPNATSQRQIDGFDATAEEARAALAAERRKYAQVRADGAGYAAVATDRYNLSRSRLASFQMTAPSDGVVLQVNQHVGEALGGAPAIQIGDTSSMYVICDAFQGDLLKIAPGMRATISSNALSHDLTGHVEWVAPLVQTNAQTGQFRVKLDDAATAGRLVGMEVNVKVEP
jgi:HlyD family secretion protein